MLGLTLGVGIVIDDAIVVLENIFRYLEEKEMSPFEAAIEATREIGLAVMATTLSLVVIFLPVAFMSSIPGRFFKSIALTMAFSIMVSLLVSFTLTPMMSARLLRRMKRKSEVVGGQFASEGQSVQKTNWLNRILDQSYTAMLRFSLKHRWVIVTLALLVFLSSVPLLIAVGKDFFPEDDQDEFEVSIRAAEGTSLQSTMAIAQKVAADVRQLPHIDYTLTTIGDDPQQTPNEAKIYVRMTPLKDREISQFDLMTQVREKVLPKYAPLNLRPVVSTVAAIGGSSRQNANLAFTIQGPDLEKLNIYSQDLLNRLKAMPGVVDADTSLIYGKPEMRAEIDRARAADLGVNVLDIAQSLRLLVGGDQISTYNENGEQYEVHVRATENYRSTADEIRKLNVPSMRLGSVGLDSVVRFSEASGPTQIERVARQRQVLLTANLEQGYSQSEIIEKVNAEVKKMNLPPEYLTGLSGRTKELKRTLDGFLLAFLLSFIFMYIVLAAQFESFIHPVTVLLALPLSLPFALLSLFVSGQSLNMFTLLGLLVLFGMVKKNSILQIDHTNGLRAKGMARYDALILASRDRLRPILMTTIAFVAGMAPLAISSGPGAGINRSTSVVVIGGQTLCLLLTLLATPVAYSIFDDVANSGIWRRVRGLGQSVRQRAAAAVSSILGTTGR
jgi:HAE1 family hydrophobic/amphiphilic exporter-1